jgi:hypothetical protein
MWSHLVNLSIPQGTLGGGGGENMFFATIICFVRYFSSIETSQFINELSTLSVLPILTTGALKNKILGR